MRLMIGVASLAAWLAACSGGSRSEGDADTSEDTAVDTAPDTAADTPPDAPADTGADTAPDPGDDAADASGDTEPDTAPDAGEDPGEDAPADPATDPPCSDPCTVGGAHVAGCTEMCGGFAGTPCRSSDLACVYVTGSDAGICIPTVSLGCSGDGECSCFPPSGICTATGWACVAGSCTPGCI
jgi:hypothetical protein